MLLLFVESSDSVLTPTFKVDQLMREKLYAAAGLADAEEWHLSDVRMVRSG
jgi:hypothetical protein